MYFIKFYVYRNPSGNWIATDLNWREVHSTWREAFNAAFIRAKRSTVGGVL